MITADTITETQIQELRERAKSAALGGNHAMVDLCDEALGWVDHRGAGDVRGARARCAVILNARADAIGIGSRVVGELDTGGELRGKVVALVGRLATVRTDSGRTFTRSLKELTGESPGYSDSPNRKV